MILFKVKKIKQSMSKKIFDFLRDLRENLSIFADMKIEYLYLVFRQYYYKIRAWFFSF